MDGQLPISADQDDDAISFGVGYRAHGRVAVIALPERVESACILALASRSERALHTGIRAIAVDLRATHHIGTHTLSELGIALLRGSAGRRRRSRSWARIPRPVGARTL